MNARSLPDGAILRPASPGDEPGILACIIALAVYEREPDAVENSVDALRDALFGADPRVFAHVVERGGDIVGIAVWFLTYSTWTGRHGVWLEDLYVDADQRGRGYGRALLGALAAVRSEEHTSELQSLMRISYAVFCLKQKKKQTI